MVLFCFKVIRCKSLIFLPVAVQICFGFLVWLFCIGFAYLCARFKGIKSCSGCKGGENGCVDHPKTECVDQLKSYDFRELL